jgi:pimeloyl-ACP methyl ester carboxylesterase
MGSAYEVRPSRRAVIAAAAASTLAGGFKSAAAEEAPKAAPSAQKTFVFAHGSWHGGWCWARVTDRLRAQGHRYFAPSYTGMGDRAHLLNKDITIDTFIDDIIGVINAEELSDVILVAHSFGGVPALGVCDRIPEKLKHVVYLDCIILENGQPAFSIYPPKEAEERIAAAETANGGLAVPVPKKLTPVWGFAEGTSDYDWVLRRLTPHPLRSYQTPLVLKNPIGNNLPCTYVSCNQPENPVINGSRKMVRGLPGWTVVDFAAPHDAMITHADKFTDVLLSV